MAAGPLPLGIAAFAAVKLAGYTLAGRTLNRANHVTRPRPLAFGAARTLLGIIAGVSYATMLGKFGVNRSEVWYYVNLPELRLSIRTSRGRIEYEGGEILRAHKKISRTAYTLEIASRCAQVPSIREPAELLKGPENLPAFEIGRAHV